MYACMYVCIPLAKTSAAAITTWASVTYRLGPKYDNARSSNGVFRLYVSTPTFGLHKHMYLSYNTFYLDK
jgi:hypothetical protein